MSRLIDWFIPAGKIANRTDRDLASIFVFTHVFGPVLAQPMWAYLWFATAASKAPLVVLIVATWSFGLLPFVLRRTGKIRLVAMLSFQGLAVSSLIASFFYGGFDSPLLPWFIVSLLIGLFYLSRDYAIVLGAFAVDLSVFIVLTVFWAQSPGISPEQMEMLDWLCISSATIYVTWMALYYSRVVGLKSELEAEAEKSRETSIELEQARTRAEQLGQQRSRFFAKMGHELRTPLNAIIGYSEIMLEDLDYSGAKDDPRRIDVSRIRAAGKHLLSLVSRVLDNNLIEDAGDDLSIERASLRVICDEVSATALPGAIKTRNRFVVNCKTPDLVFETDTTKLRQILINLLSNAAKFTSDGIIKLDVRIDAQDDRGVLKAVVSDTGIGIPPEGLERIFRNYEQASVQTVAKYGGTGIGLSLSQQFAHLMSGEITAESVEGEGSKFSLSIPVALPQSCTAEAHEGAGGAAHAAGKSGAAHAADGTGSGRPSLNIEGTPA